MPWPWQRDTMKERVDAIGRAEIAERQAALAEKHLSDTRARVLAIWARAEQERVNRVVCALRFGSQLAHKQERQLRPLQWRKA